MGGLDVINILDGLDDLFKKSFWMDGLDVIIILDGLDGCPSDGMDWMLDGLLTTLHTSIDIYSPDYRVTQEITIRDRIAWPCKSSLFVPI